MRRASWVVVGLPAVIVVMALIFVLQMAGGGCGGGSPYESSVRGIIRELDKMIAEVDVLMNGAPAQQTGGVAQQAASAESMKQAMTQMSAALSKAEAGLQALTPPDAAARSWQTAYLDTLKDYLDGVQALTVTFDYAVAASAAVDGVVPQQSEGGVWTDISNLTQTGINEQNVAQLAGLLEAAEPVLAAGLQRWVALTPPEELKPVHETISADLDKIDQNLGLMAGLARAGADSGSAAELSELTLRWELAVELWNTLFADLDVWLNKTSGLADSMASRLNSFQDDLDELAKTL
jgi:hypothetical protein